MKKLYKIHNVEKWFENQLFWRQIEARNNLEEFKNTAEIISVKNKIWKIKETIKDLKMKEYFVEYWGDDFYYDDVVDIYYKK